MDTRCLLLLGALLLCLTATIVAETVYLRESRSGAGQNSALQRSDKAAASQLPLLADMPDTLRCWWDTLDAKASIAATAFPDEAVLPPYRSLSRRSRALQRADALNRGTFKVRAAGGHTFTAAATAGTYLYLAWPGDNNDPKPSAGDHWREDHLTAVDLYAADGRHLSRLGVYDRAEISVVPAAPERDWLVVRTLVDGMQVYELDTQGTPLLVVACDAGIGNLASPPDATFFDIDRNGATDVIVPAYADWTVAQPAAGGYGYLSSVAVLPADENSPVQLSRQQWEQWNEGFILVHFTTPGTSDEDSPADIKWWSGPRGTGLLARLTGITQLGRSDELAARELAKLQRKPITKRERHMAAD